jgi:two-component system, NtrC family, sensor kinase
MLGMSATTTRDTAWVYDFYRLGQSLVLTQEPAAVRRNILEHLVQALRARSGSLVLADAGRTDTLVLVAGIGVPESVIGQQVKPGEGVLGWVVEHDEALILNGDIASDARFQRKDKTQRRTSIPASALCWPLKGSGGRLIGIISANRHAGDPFFTEDDLAHGQTLGALITLQIENHWLHEKQAQRIRELSQLNLELNQAQRDLQLAHHRLLQSEKDALLGRLAAGVAHEINNPLGYVYSNLGTLHGYLDRIMAGQQGQVDAEERDYLSRDSQALIHDCLEGIRRIRYIVRDLQGFSRVGDEDWQMHSLHDELESALKVVLHGAPADVQIERRLGQLPDIECLPGRIHQIFSNILKNALQAAGAGGRIRIETDAAADEVRVRISDSGPGVPPHLLPRVFDPFFTTKPVGQGVGLGLALVQNLVHKHRGRIAIENAPDGGACVSLCFPIHQSQSDDLNQVDHANSNA